LTRIGSLLIMGLFGLIIASLVNIFFHSSAVYWIITYVGILIFVGLVAYDTQKLKRMALSFGEDGALMQKASILGALNLYLDFINLFLLLLRVLGRRK
jgi:FtsH-binding integral membrane protein